VGAGSPRASLARRSLVNVSKALCAVLPKLNAPTVRPVGMR
jgi:hypothetical protein